jgi:(1->4)-alpha-D-glucan 1-alpha-D-glucosylmutase
MSSRKPKSKYGGTSGHRVINSPMSEANQPRSRRLREPGEERSLQELPSLPGVAPLQKKIPGATYRFQFNHKFTFSQAREAVAYLHELGITVCYASPLFKARPGSMHGYDVCAPNELNPELGTPADFLSFSDQLRQEGLGLLLDIVPNHMGTDCSNDWWFDVLRNGPASRHAKWFDIDWKPANPATVGKVLLPILEDHYARVLEAGKLKIVHDAGKLFVAYHDHKFPLSPQSSRMVKQQVSKLGLEVVLQELNAAGEIPTYADLHQLLRQQHFRFAFWRVASEEINYRRFFDVSDLISVRVELPEVFHAVHELVFSLIRQGRVTGLRVDHPDGLWDPRTYFSRLQDEFTSPEDESGNADPDKPAQPAPRSEGEIREPNESRLFVVAEKILTDDERLRDDWEVDGTTGYDFLNQANAIFVDSAGEEAFDRLYHEFTGCDTDFQTLVYQNKKRILLFSFVSELNALTRRLKEIAALTRYGQDFTPIQLRMALVETIACFPVYRSYIGGETTQPASEDRLCIDEAVKRARPANTDKEPAALDFLHHILLLELPKDLSANGQTLCREFAMKFQQLTGPVMAKGVEDTTFYNYNRLVSLNEVGGNPGIFGRSPEAFHQYNFNQAKAWPHSLLATATHDTKRGEDLRARLNVLSEMPDEWGERVKRWQAFNLDKKTLSDGVAAPDANDEYLLYQTLVGTWTAEAETNAGLQSLRDRLAVYMLKATRESKAHTCWTDPDAAYEKAVETFVKKLLDDGASRAFLDDFRAFQKRVAFFGQYNSLAQLLLKLTCPGVADFYQGTELWDFSLVDPDNRRPVDYETRKRLLKELQAGFEKDRDKTIFFRGLNKKWEDGRTKLFLAWRSLSFRNHEKDIFSDGAYVPLAVSGEREEHVFAFARQLKDRTVLAIVPRLICGLLDGTEKSPLGLEVWGDTAIHLPNHAGPGTFENPLTGEKVKAKGQRLSVGGVLNSFPVAVLASVAAR